MRFINSALQLLLVVSTTSVITIVSVSGRVSNGNIIHRSIIEGSTTNPFLPVNSTNSTIGGTGNITAPVIVDDGAVNDTMTDDDHDDDAAHEGGDDDEHEGKIFPWGSSGLTVSPLLNWPTDKCISNLTMIMDDIILKGQLEAKEYIICPNTTYNIGVDDFGTCCKPGSHHPFVLRSYTTYKCGFDGAATNNCIISGGNFLIMSSQHDFPGEPANGINFLGLTFEKSDSFVALIGNEGTFTFNDCIFRNVAGLGTIGLVYNPTPYVNDRRDRFLLDNNKYDENDPFVKLYNHAARGPSMSSVSSSSVSEREMVTSSTNAIAQSRRCVVTFSNCVFTNITLGPETTFAQPYILYVEPTFHDLIVTDTIFINNNYLFPNEVIDGYAIKIAQENTIKLENNCFINNKFFGDGVVVLNQTVLESNINNYITTSGDDITTATTRSSTGSMDPNLRCQFIHNKLDSTCIDADAKTCPLLNTETLVSSPAPITNVTAANATPEQNTTTGTGTGTSASTTTTTTTTLFYSSFVALFVALVTAL